MLNLEETPLTQRAGTMLEQTDTTLTTLNTQLRGHIDFGMHGQDECGPRLEIPFAWWRGTVVR